VKFRITVTAMFEYEYDPALYEPNASHEEVVAIEVASHTDTEILSEFIGNASYTALDVKGEFLEEGA
jgi:hypothetical protein